MKAKAAAIIPAAGFGTRMQCGQPKQYLELLGVPIFIRTLQPFIDSSCITRIVVVVPEERIGQTRDLCSQFLVAGEKIALVAGGRRRQDSVLAGLEALPEDIEIIVVHDGARPLVSQEVIERCYEQAVDKDAVIAAVPVKDTIKRADGRGRIAATVAREDLWQAQTPQAMKRDLLVKAYAEYGHENATDEASLLEKSGVAVHLVLGAETNLKITRPEDLLLAEKILASNGTKNRLSPGFRIGHGFDAHRLVADRELVLGGVKIAHSHGLAGHSDADVLTHALCDAILGAIGEGDIGKHFPDNDDSFLGIRSIILLERVVELVEKKGFAFGNADITVICQAPRLASSMGDMKKILSRACRTDLDHINIKATTTEKMGFAGRKEGISCHAVVLLYDTNF